MLGRVTEESRRQLEAIVQDMAGTGCDAAILGCTELPLILGKGLPVPALDSTRLLARAALDHALAGTGAA